MGQNYLWKVEYYHYHYGQYCYDWYYGSKVFSNKITALNFINRLQNNDKYDKIRLIKWFG